MRPTRVSGKLWVLRDPNRQLYDDVDTDMIFHNRYLHLTDLAEMGRYALDNLRGWEDFSQRVRPGDIVMAGRNFGAGSSRQQAVDCFLALEIGALVAESFAVIYQRNAINSGLAVITFPTLSRHAEIFRSGDQLTLDFASGLIQLNGERIYHAQPFSQVQMAIYQAGDLFAYGR